MGKHDAIFIAPHCAWVGPHAPVSGVGCVKRVQVIGGTSQLPWLFPIYIISFISRLRRGGDPGTQLDFLVLVHLYILTSPVRSSGPHRPTKWAVTPSELIIG